MGGDSISETRVIELGEEREAEHVDTTDFFFAKIGESVPLTPNDSSYDLQNPPSIPLTVSERFRLIFVAHPSDGFCVAKTADIINLAKDLKTDSASSSVLDVSILHVPLGRVSVLCLSTDSSTLAASVGGDIYLFSVRSLLSKEKQPLRLLSIESQNNVKHISWTKKRDNLFVVLSNTGTLYSGDLKQSLKHVMDDVDAVDWSTKGEFLAIARKQVVSILTPEFNERKQILLHFKSGLADANKDALIVDSIRWIRPDCMVIGCLEESVVSKEENYLLQIIMCENGEEITDASSRPVILCLSDLFLSISDDVMPSGHGPHLLLNYLETRQLAVLGNRKNTDQHIVLVGWLDHTDEPAVIHIERDNWLPRIELQESGDDNVLLGMCIDRASVYENIEVKLGEDDLRNLSPYCIFLCLTHEGKLVIFHFASLSGDSGAPDAVPVPSDEEEEISTSGTPELPTISVEQNDDKIKPVVSDLRSCDMYRDKSAAAEVDQQYFEKTIEASYTDKSSTSLPAFNQASTIGRTAGLCVPTAKDHHGPSPSADLDKRLGDEKSVALGNECLNQNTMHSFAADASKFNAKTLNGAEKLKDFGDDDKIKPAVSDLESCDTFRDKSAPAEVDQRYFEKTREASYTNKSLTSLSAFNQASAIGRTAGLCVPTAKNQHGPSPSADLDKRLGDGKSGALGNKCLNQNTLQSFAADTSKLNAKKLNEAEKLNAFGLRSTSGYPVGENFAISSVFKDARSNQPIVFNDALEQGVGNLSGSYSSSGSIAINAARATSAPTNVTMGTHGMQVQGVPGKAVSHVHPINVNPKNLSQSRAGLTAETSAPTNVNMNIRSMRVEGLQGKTVSQDSKSTSISTHSNFEPSLSKKYGNMKDMTSELDKLLQCIEQPGGFMDACTTSQKFLEKLEETMIVLCHKCTTWQSLLDEQAESIQLLLDNTVQVLARKVYMEGIVKQTRDMQYWDLWNRQKLSSELQMKRQSVISLSQNLINQLIELEKHFNALEVNSYGESSGVNFSDQSFRGKYAPSRRIQSIHAVHNAVNSQLAAAEQLSECLSRQMDVLSIRSPSVEPGNVKDQLFKMIGISCESHSEISSQIPKFTHSDTPRVSPLLSSVAGIKGNDFRSNQTDTNNPEPETARRRRDSFDQNWANFEPSKTTLKRILRGNACSDMQRPSLFMDKRFSNSSNAEGSIIAPSSGHSTHFGLFHDARGVEDTFKNALPKSSSRTSRDKDLPEPSTSSVNRASVKQLIDKRVQGGFSPDSPKYSGVLEHVKKPSNPVITERPDHEGTDFENPESVFSKESNSDFAIAQSSQDQPKFQSSQFNVSPFPKTTNSMLTSYNSKDSTPLKGAGNIVEPKVSRSSPSGSRSWYQTESSNVLSLPDEQARFAQLGTPTSGVESGEVLTGDITAKFPPSFPSFVEPASKSLFSPSSSATGQKVLSTITTGSLNSTTDNQYKLALGSQQTSLGFSFSSSVAFSPNSLSASKSLEKNDASAFESSANSRVKPVTIELQSSGDKVRGGSSLSDASSRNPVDTLACKSHEMSASSPMTFSMNSTSKTPTSVHQPSTSKVDAGTPQKEQSTSQPSWNFPTFTGSSSIASTTLTSGSNLSSSNTTDVVLNSEDKKASGAFVFPQAQSSTPSDSAVYQEDEMEEEAADLSLGSLGGLGLGSGPSAGSPFGSNPFGGAAASTSFTPMSSSAGISLPSGQLFQPASFSFPSLQPPQQPKAENAGGFNQVTNIPAPSGQPAQSGSGLQALGSVLGSFGQSRQLGPAVQGNTFGGAGFGQPGGGFANAASSTGGFAGLSAGGAGGFAAVGAPSGGGFAGLSASGSGFAAVGATGGGFAGTTASGAGFGNPSGFGTIGGGGGFGSFSNQGGSGGGGFSSFGGGVGGTQPPPSQLFTQMRK